MEHPSKGVNVEELKSCPFCGANPYKDSVPCDNEEMAKQCKEVANKLDKCWERAKE